MKRFGRSWQRLLTLWVVLAAASPALADDPVAVTIGLIGDPGRDPSFPPPPPHVLSPGAPIPANGGILIESSDGSTVIADVRDATERLVPGTTTLLSTREESNFFVWKPVTEPGLGPHSVSLRSQDGSSLVNTIMVEIVAATDRARPVLAVSPSIATFTTPTGRACCLTTSQDLTDHCALSEQQTLAQVDPGLASTETISALNQFLFRARVAEGTAAPNVAPAFLPFGSDAAMRFEQAADEYCIEIDALDIVTMAEHRYPDLDHCVTSSGVDVGTMPIALDGAFLADERCVMPPSGHEEQWCEVHGDDCDDGNSVDCTLFQYACEGIHPSEPGDAPDAEVVRIPEPSSDEQCSVSAPGSPRSTSRSLVHLGVFVLALLVCRGRRSWQALLALALVLASGAPALADEPVVLSPGAPIPANGAILIESRDGSPVIAAVFDATGAKVEGTTTLLNMQVPAYFTWLPASGELDVGRYWVELRNEGGTAVGGSSQVEVVAAVERTKPVLTVSPTVSTFTATSARACCLTLLVDGLDHCALTEQQTFAQVDPGFSSTETVATLNQFLFRVRAAEGSVEPALPPVFLPFVADAALRFEVAADEYCLEVDALDIATMEEHSYPDLDHCVDGSGVTVGTTPIELDDTFLASQMCIRPPVGREERWCEVNGDVCDDGMSLKCTQFQDSCLDRPSPDAGSEADADAPEPEPDAALPAPRNRSSSDDCNVSTPGARKTYGHFVALMLFALYALCFRQSKADLGPP